MDVKRKVIHVATFSLSNIMPGIGAAEYSPTEYSPYSGGWHARLANQLAKASEKYAYECWALEKNLRRPIKWEQGGIVYRLFPARHVKYFGDISLSLLRAIKKEDKKGNLISIHELYTPMTYVMLLVVSRAPVVIHHHGSLSALQQRNYAITSTKRLAYLALFLLSGQWFFEKFSFTKADRIFVLNEETRAHIEKLVGRDKVERLTMGIDFNRFYPIDKKKARRTVGLSEHVPYILYVGSLVRAKGVDTLLRAFKIIVKECPAAQLLLLGQGYYRNALVGLTRELGIEDSVRFLPDSNGKRVADHELPLYYNAAHVFVLPSDYEGFGVVLVEAIACHTPVVATNVGGIPEVVESLNAGVLVPRRDPEMLARRVVEILSGYRKFTFDTQKAARYYDWKVITRRVLEVYDQIFSTIGS